MLTIVITYLLLGAVAGLLAGLLGIGGGLVIVPLLDFCMAQQGIPRESIMHLALGTSLATIIFTSASSAWAHHRRGAVHWPVVRRIVLGILVGTFCGSFLVAQMSADHLKGFFVAFLYYVAWQLLKDSRPKPSRDLPGPTGMFGVGSGIGAVSSLVGIGGGTLSIPFMIWCNVAIHNAIGTSAAIGFPIALAGTAGYLYNGWGLSGLPKYTAGYVYLPALAGIVCASVLTAPFGVKLAHSLPVPRLKKGFALLIILVGTRMLITLLM